MKKFEGSFINVEAPFRESIEADHFRFAISSRAAFVEAFSARLGPVTMFGSHKADDRETPENPGNGYGSVVQTIERLGVTGQNQTQTQ
jgi:hypothetical protein